MFKSLLVLVSLSLLSLQAPLPPEESISPSDTFVKNLEAKGIVAEEVGIVYQLGRRCANVSLSQLITFSFSFCISVFSCHYCHVDFTSSVNGNALNNALTATFASMNGTDRVSSVKIKEHLRCDQLPGKLGKVRLPCLSGKAS